jgi:hypothetical protein
VKMSVDQKTLVRRGMGVEVWPAGHRAGTTWARGTCRGMGGNGVAEAWRHHAQHGQGAREDIGAVQWVLI